MPTFYSKVYRFYRYKLYPSLSRLRGATWLSDFLYSRAKEGLKEYEDEPRGIFEKNWDNLIILDACRYDEYNRLRDYKVESRVTLGSSSKEFVEENFDAQYDNIVYITANGFLTDEMMEENLGNSNPFFEKFETIKESWDSEEGTVHPEDVVEDAVTAEKLFPEKKKIIHFIQPHYPFLTRDFGERSDSYLPDGGKDALKMAEEGKIRRSEILEAYRENLDIVLRYADELADSLEGTTVISADHGELLGENGLYGHPMGSSAKYLRKVPWDVISEE